MSFKFDGLPLAEKERLTKEWIEQIDENKYRKQRNFFMPFFSFRPRSLRLYHRGVSVAPKVENL